MQYTLTAPMIITSRLMPGIKIGDSTISIEASDKDPWSGAVTYAYYIDTPEGEIYSRADLQVRTGDRGVREATRALLSFLSADAESYRETMGAWEPSDGWLFDARTAEWAYMNDDELSMAQCELEEC